MIIGIIFNQNGRGHIVNNITNQYVVGSQLIISMRRNSYFAFIDELDNILQGNAHTPIIREVDECVNGSITPAQIARGRF